MVGRPTSSLVAELMGGLKSPLSKSAATKYVQLFKQRGSVADLCQAGHLYCNAQTYESYYEKELQVGEKVEVKDIPVFFSESELIVGHEVTIADPRLQSAALEINRQAIISDPRESKYTYLNVNKVPERAFLPTELAQSLPITTSSASQIFKLDESSTLAKQSSQTVEICKEGVHGDGSTELQGEAAACALSLEGLQSLLSSPMLLGPHDAAHVEALTTSNLQEGQSFTGKVVHVSLKASEVSRHAVCHNLMYPSAVYFCHYLPHTRVYALTLLQQGTVKPQLLHAVAMCHMDTNGWNPAHLAFQNLRTVPGQSEACHWVLQGSVTFVPAG